MKLGKIERAFLAAAAAAVLFTGGYFTGRAKAGNVNITVSPAPTAGPEDLAPAPTADPEPSGLPAGESGQAGETALVDLNTATQRELEGLPGIGPALAARILEYRAAYGPFASTEELMNVRGIGEKIYEALKDRVRV